jgi:hypothetical protein
MSGMRQKIQYSLALEPTHQGETPVGGCQGTEPVVAKPAPQSPALAPTSCRCPSSTPSNRRVRDPYARWCGRGGTARCPPIPIFGASRPLACASSCFRICFPFADLEQVAKRSGGARDPVSTLPGPTVSARVEGNEGGRFRRPCEVARLPPMAGSVGRTTWASAACSGSR